MNAEIRQLVLNRLDEVPYSSVKAIVKHLHRKMERADATRRSVERELSVLVAKRKVRKLDEYYCLPRKFEEMTTKVAHMPRSAKASSATTSNARTADHPTKSSPNDKAKRRPPLKRKHKFSRAVEVVHLKCERHPSRRATHLLYETTWGNVFLCAQCAAEIMEKDIAHSSQPFVREIPSAIESNRNRH